MKYEEIKYNLFFVEDDGAETPPDSSEDPEAELQDKITKKIDEIGHIASKQLEKMISSKIDIFLNKVRKTGIDEVLENFVVQKFIPSLENQDDKLFITVNLDDFVAYLSEKFSAKLIDNVSSDKPKDKDKDKDEDTKSEEK
jgi:hypothetical protein